MTAPTRPMASAAPTSELLKFVSAAGARRHLRPYPAGGVRPGNGRGRFYRWSRAFLDAEHQHHDGAEPERSLIVRPAALVGGLLQKGFSSAVVRVIRP